MSLKVQECSLNNNYKVNNSPQKSEPNFKAGVLDVAGSTMQWIQDRGFLASFLIQDGLGMTMPRVATGFLRDKEVTGKFNTQEGFEVLGREGMTGPIMMAMAPLMLLIAAKFGKSTSVNSQLIKRFGNSLKSIITKPGFDRNILKDKELFRKNFFNENIEKMLKETLGEGKYSKNDVKNLRELVNGYMNIPKESQGAFKKGKYKNAKMNEIISYINNLKYSGSSELNMLEKVRIDGHNFATKDAFDAMIKYSDDALSLGKHLETLDEAGAESFKNKSIGKRAITTVSTVLATLGVMSVLPKIYARNSIAPGARTAMELQQKAQEEKEKNNEEVSFKAKAPKKSLLDRLGSFISKHVKENLASEIEYNGHNFTNTLMACLSIFGLLIPRGMRAVNRAQKDEVTGKKDLTELYEILIRDLFSSMSVIFAVPMLTRVFVSSYENKSGFVLLEKDRSRTGWKAAMDLLNPYSSSHVLSNKEIQALYNGVDSKAKMLNFCEYIDKNGGNLQKILSKSDFHEEIFNKSTKTLEELSKMSKAESNKEIKKIIGNMKNSDELIKNLMNGIKKKGKVPNIMSAARGLNSVPALLTTFLISPVILGWFIPRLTYANTRRIHAKQAQEREQAKINAAA